ncbi:hypothetical protein BDV09DRAFT_197955 [Aspergillus tetrazonus]
MSENNKKQESEHQGSSKPPSSRQARDPAVTKYRSGPGPVLSLFPSRLAATCCTSGPTRPGRNSTPTGALAHNEPLLWVWPRGAVWAVAERNGQHDLKCGVYADATTGEPWYAGEGSLGLVELKVEWEYASPGA